HGAEPRPTRASYCPCEWVGGGAAGALAEPVVTGRQTPTSLKPLPLTWPGFVACTKRESGAPWEANWRLMSGRLTTLRPLTPVGVTPRATTSGFQTARHADVVQMNRPCRSALNEESGKPLRVTRIVLFSVALCAVLTSALPPLASLERVTS